MKQNSKMSQQCFFTIVKVSCVTSSTKSLMC